MAQTSSSSPVLATNQETSGNDRGHTHNQGNHESSVAISSEVRMLDRSFMNPDSVHTDPMHSELDEASADTERPHFCTQPTKARVDTRSQGLDEEINIPDTHPVARSKCCSCCCIKELAGVLAKNNDMKELAGVLAKNNDIMEKLGNLLSVTLKHITSHEFSLDPEQYPAQRRIGRSKSAKANMYTASGPCGKVVRVDNPPESHVLMDRSAAPRKRTNDQSSSPGLLKKGIISVSVLEQPELRLNAESLGKANAWNLSRDWIVLSDTYDIRISGSQLKMFLQYKAVLPLCLCRAITHMLQYKEGMRAALYKDYIPTHYFTAGQSFRSSSPGDPLGGYMQALRHYKINTCDTYVALVENNMQWACYSFYVPGKVETIIDPCSESNSQEDIIEKHKTMLNSVRGEVIQFARSLHNKPAIGCEPWQTQTINGQQINFSGADSGLYALLGAQEVNAKDGTAATIEGTPDWKKFSMIDDLLKMAGNMAKIP